MTISKWPQKWFPQCLSHPSPKVLGSRAKQVFPSQLFDTKSAAPFMDYSQIYKGTWLRTYSFSSRGCPVTSFSISSHQTLPSYKWDLMFKG